LADRSLRPNTQFHVSLSATGYGQLRNARTAAVGDHFGMTSPGLKFGIPDIELGSASGTIINPSDFVGHDLIALFCPMDRRQAADEIKAYESHSNDFVNCDAWLLAFAVSSGEVAVDGDQRVLSIPDPDNVAWAAFRELALYPEELDRSNGATFLFSRGGGLHRHWPGAGHVDDVIAELQVPSFRHDV
jgi:hypothetical protein